MSLGVLAGCGGGGPTGPVTSAHVLSAVLVSLSSATITVGQTTTASAEGLDERGAAIGIGAPAWSTSSPVIATVNASGIVSAVAPGQTMITAVVNGNRGQMLLTVVPVPVASVLIAPAAAALQRGTTLQLTATTLDNSGRVLPQRAIVWTSLDPARAIVTTTGIVTAVGVGVATLTATCEGVSASIVLTVTGTGASVATVTVSPLSTGLTVGGSVQLAAILRDVAGNALTGRTVTWASSVVNAAPMATGASVVVTVSAAGLVTAMSPGTVIIQAFSEGVFGAATITVKDDADESIVISFGAPIENALVGDTLFILAAVKSSAPLASVVATVGSLKTTLKFTSVGALGGGKAWTGFIVMEDLPTGPYKLVITATDILNAHGVGSITFQRDTRTGKGGTSPAPKMK